MGVFGNGRFFEGLLIRIRLQTLQELQDLASAAEQELQQVIPSFIRRAEPNHRHFYSQLNFQQQSQNLLNHGATADSRIIDSQTASVELLSYDPEAESRCWQLYSTKTAVVLCPSPGDCAWDIGPSTKTCCTNGQTCANTTPQAGSCPGACQLYLRYRWGLWLLPRSTDIEY